MSARIRAKRLFLFFALCAPMVCALTAVGASVACASPAGEHGFTGDQWLNLLWRIATVALVVGVIWYFVGKKAVAFFRGRKSGIEQELHDFEARKEEARANLLDVEKRIANLEKERQAIMDDYRARAEAMANDIIAKAEERAAQISTQAKQAAENEIDQALAAMRAELAEAIAQATRELLADSLTPKQHEELIDSFLNKVVLQ